MKLSQLLDVLNWKQIGASSKRLTDLDERRPERDQLLAKQGAFLAAQLRLRQLLESPAARVEQQPKHEKDKRNDHSPQSQVAFEPDVRK